jgi:hypothetical protein
MGVTSETLDLITPYLYFSKKICDFGAQQFKVCPPFKENTYFREYVENLDKEYLSIDLTEEDKSIPLDMCKDFPDIYKNYFDLVLDIGTSEHVEDYFMCMKNIHNVCNINGYMIHVVPSPKNWPGHGYHYVNMDFFIELAANYGYDIIEMFIRKCSFGGLDSHQTHVVFCKKENFEFTKDKFPFHLVYRR